ncbi:5f5db801-8520-4de4-94c6-9ccd253673f8 [Thermothielavioides terrestris]|uniref:Uncharacterized protein n=2 Tax=Thermothielavioides terrestris TaxID=2587410 RepID=G2QSD5_THETT|nr:uncharacterized protein THITE_2084131 [Thermothielavioides terrestris NRRL 8126]AEO62616.1 hypothetical protein THITE_2084131 [Thermothielavioides terrestris NRRL 8126]SPQ21885.1 5f5db801-8520-4de4-94c6-9ccd253673f8 [Thermothielavioides terrestris]
MERSHFRTPTTDAAITGTVPAVLASAATILLRLAPVTALGSRPDPPQTTFQPPLVATLTVSTATITIQLATSPLPAAAPQSLPLSHTTAYLQRAAARPNTVTFAQAFPPPTSIPMSDASAALARLRLDYSAGGWREEEEEDRDGDGDWDGDADGDGDMGGGYGWC